MTTTDLRDAIVRQLVTPTDQQSEPAGQLLQLDAVGAALLLPAWGSPLVLLVWPGDWARDELEQRVHRVMETARPGVTHLAIVGGGEQARAFAKEVQPFWQLDRRLALHHVEESGEVHDIGGKLAPLTEAAERAVREPFAPITPEELVLWRNRMRSEMQADQEFFRALHQKQPLATYALIAANVVLFALETLWDAPESGRMLLRMGALSRDEVLQGDWWRLFSAAFLHGSVLHVAVNCWSLYALGPFVERLFGSARFLVLYGLSALAGSLASASFSGHLSVGASGAIFGVFGALIALALGKSGPLPTGFRANLKRSLFAPIAINVAISFQAGVDKFAHFGGLLVGALIALVFSRTVLGRGESAPRSIRPPAVATRLTAAALCVVMAASVGSALAHGQPWTAEQLPSFERVQLDGAPLTVEVPRGVAHERTPTKDDVLLWSVGDLDRDGFVARFIVVPLPETPDAQAERASMEEHEAALKKQELPPGSRDAQVRLVELDGRPVVSSSFVQADGIRRQRWILVRGANLVSVDLGLLPETPVTWEQGLERIPRSVEAQTPTAAEAAPQ